MRAIILDHTDGTVVLIDIPAEWKERVDEYIGRFISTSECSWMAVQDELTDVYKLVCNGDDEHHFEMVGEV